jgi:hypothetical protein
MELLGVLCQVDEFLLSNQNITTGVWTSLIVSKSEVFQLSGIAGVGVTRDLC